MACEKAGGGGALKSDRGIERCRMLLFFYNDCFNVNFQISDDAFVMELRDSIQIYEEAAKTK